MKKMLFAAWSCSNKNYFAYQSWYKPLKSIFHNLLIFDPQKTLYEYGKDKMNQDFLYLVEKEKPDYIFLWLIYDEFYLDTLFKIKKISPKTKIINFFGDDDTLFENFSIYYSIFVDFPLVSHRNFFNRYRKNGIRNSFLFCGVDTKVFRPLKTIKKYDVTFIGTPKRDRYNFIKYLIENGIDVRVYGHGWGSYNDLSKIYHGKVNTKEMVKIINQTRINLSFSKNYYGKPSFKSRVFEIASCGSFVVTEYFKDYDYFFRREIPMFKNKQDLLRIVKYYLKNTNKRERLEKYIYNIAKNNHSQSKILYGIFNKINGINENKLPPKPSKKIVYIYSNELKLSRKEIENKIRDFDYVSFKDENEHLQYKDYMQIYAIEKSKKAISCCDYYLSSYFVGNYISIYFKQAFSLLSKKDFLSILRIGQLVMKKKFFLENIDKFKDFENKKSDFDFKNNMCFVSIPLLKVKKYPKIEYNNMEKVSLPLFENQIRKLYKRPFNLLLPKLLFFCLMNSYTLKYIKKHYLKTIIKSTHFKLNRMKFSKLYLKSNQIYKKINY